MPTYCREEMLLSTCSLETKPRKFPRKTSYPEAVRCISKFVNQYHSVPQDEYAFKSNMANLDHRRQMQVNQRPHWTPNWTRKQPVRIICRSCTQEKQKYEGGI